jgi:cytochrome c-type protein NapC
VKKLFLVLFFGLIIGLAISLLAAELIEQTSGKDFCSSCHSMKTVSQAYSEDVHGGANALGFAAKCVDCHLPHDNVLHYVTAKAYSGTKDVLGEIFWAKSFDWIANLKKKEEFTYTSGCLKCHDLSIIRYEIPKAFLAHKDFLSGKVPSCLKCHEHVGHKNIKDALTEQR